MSTTPTTSTTTTTPRPCFAPRRFGHVNVYVGDLRAADEFYRGALGIALAFDEPGVAARFLSNGNTHHDIALMQASDRELAGRDGRVQKSSERGRRPGLNHIAFETPTEAGLVEGHRRALERSVTIHRCFDHVVSRSVYLPDPDGNEIELYADTDSDWRELLDRHEGELITSVWDPQAEVSPSPDPHHPTHVDHRPVPDAPVQPVRAAGATIVVASLDRAIEHYEDVVGLTVTDRDHQGWAVMSGSLGLADLLLISLDAARVDGAEVAGFHHASFEMADPDAVDRAEHDLPGLGVAVERSVSHPAKRFLTVRDPDGRAVELFARPDGHDSAERRSLARVAGVTSVL